MVQILRDPLYEVSNSSFCGIVVEVDLGLGDVSMWQARDFHDIRSSFDLGRRSIFEATLKICISYRRHCVFGIFNIDFSWCVQGFVKL